MQKIDYKKEYGRRYKASAKQIAAIEVPAMHFLMIDGKGEPGGPLYAEAVEALFSVSYTVKFMVKKGDIGIDYGVMPLEGLWWAENMEDFVTDKRENWQWSMMIMQPELVTKALVDAALEQVEAKKGLPALPRIRYASFEEGQCAQILHVGPFSEEAPTIEKLHAWIREQGHELAGKHHEIYLSDIRRAAPERWKTIIRQPYL